MLSIACQWTAHMSQRFVMTHRVIVGDSLVQHDPAVNRDYPMISLKLELQYVDLPYST